MAAGRNIKGITVEIGGDTTKLQTALKNVNSTIKDTQNQLKDVEKLLKLDPGNTELLTQKQRLLTDAISDTESKLETLHRAAEQANTALASGDITRDQYDALQREIIETEQKLQSLEGEYKNFGSVAAQQVALAGEKMQEFGGKVEGLGNSLTSSVTAPLVNFGKTAVENFAGTDKIMQLTNKTMGNTAEEAEILSKAMKTAAANSTFGMADAANASLNFARAGLKAEEAAAALAPAMNLAAGEGGNLDTVSAGLVATINGFHDSFERTAFYADVFASACNNSALDVDSLASSMSVAAPIFSAAGYSIQDATLFLGVMANNGIEAGQAANSLKSGLARLISPTEDAAILMDELGISITNADGSMKSSIIVQRELHDAFAQLSESEQIAAADTIFGKFQMAAWLALINTAPGDVLDLSDSIYGASLSIEDYAKNLESAGLSLDALKSNMLNLGVDADYFESQLKVCGGDAELFAENLWEVCDGGVELEDVVNALGGDLDVLQTAMDNTKGTTEEMAEAMMSGFGGSMVKLESSIDVLVNSIGEALAPTILQVANLIQNLVDKFNSLTPAQQQVVVKIGMVVAAIGPALIIIGKIITSVGTILTLAPKVVSAIKAAKAAFMAFNAVLAANPIGAIITVIGLLVGALIYLWNTNDAFREACIETWNSIKTNALALWGDVKNFFSETWSEIKENALTAWEDFKNFFSETWNGIKELAESILNTIRDFFAGIWDSIATTASDAWDAIRDTVGGFLQDIHEKVTSVWRGIYDTISPLLKALKYLFETIWQAIPIVINLALDAISAKIEKVWNDVVDFLTPILTGIKDFFAFVWNGIKNLISSALGVIKEAVTSFFTGVKNVTSQGLNWIKNAFATAWTAVADFLTPILEVIKEAVTSFFTGVKNVISQGLNWIKNAFATAWTAVADFLTPILEVIKQKITKLLDSAKTGAQQAIKKVNDFITEFKESIKRHFDEIANFFVNFAKKARDWGKDLVQGFIDGIKNKIQDLANTITGIADKIHEVLHFSRPDKGPLVDYESWMPDFISGLARGIRKNEHLIKNAMAGITSNLEISPQIVRGAASAAANNADTIKSLEILHSDLNTMNTRLGNMQIVLNTGALVGNLAENIDKILGVRAVRYSRERGI